MAATDAAARKNSSSRIPYFRPSRESSSGWLAILHKTPLFLSHLYIKTNILPRQARDKHRENSKKWRFSHRVGNSTTCETPGRSTSQLVVLSGEKKTADSFIGREKDS
jgi:hypothetical protein